MFIVKRHRWYFIISLLFCVGIMSNSWADNDKRPRVVVSLKPLHSLVSAVMQDVGKPDLLVDAAQSPHTFQMKPSQIQKIQDADLIIWVGPNLETALAKPLQSVPSKTQIMEIGKLPQLNLLRTRVGCDHCGNGHYHYHETGDKDLHVWLDPILMKDVVEEIILRLTSLDPSHALKYRENGLFVQQMLNKLDQDLHRQLVSIKNKPYMLHHDAQQYFERRYGLQAPTIIALNHYHALSAKRMNELKNQIERYDIQCIFVEPQLPRQQAETLAETAKINVATIDLLGIIEPSGPDLYPTMMRSLAKAMTTCLEVKED